LNTISALEAGNKLGIQKVTVTSKVTVTFKTDKTQSHEKGQFGGVNPAALS
jgi:hypothetical protein